MYDSTNIDHLREGAKIEENQQPSIYKNLTESGEQLPTGDSCQKNFEVRNHAVIDVSNVARAGPGKPRISRIQSLLSVLNEINIPYICIADASLRHIIDDKILFETLIDQGLIIQVPAGTPADVFIRETVEMLQSCRIRPILVTNDRRLAKSVSQVTCLKFLFVPIGPSVQILFYPKLEEVGLEKRRY